MAIIVWSTAEIKGLKVQDEELKLALYADNLAFLLINPKRSVEKLIVLLHEFNFSFWL